MATVITLIFADRPGRCRRTVIRHRAASDLRRELESQSGRRGYSADAALLGCDQRQLTAHLGGWLLWHPLADRPDEPGGSARTRHHGFRPTEPARQMEIAAMQAMLRPPGQVDEVDGKARLALLQCGGAMRDMPRVVRRLYQHVSQVRIASARDAPA